MSPIRPSGDTSQNDAPDVNKPTAQDALSPISQLSSEVLSEIFRMVSSERDYLAPHPCFTLSHVCRFWYAVATDDSALWADPDFRRPRLALAMLARSRDMPLSMDIDVEREVHLDGNGDPMADAVSEAGKSSGRIKRLALRYRHYRTVEFLLKQFGGPFSMLESLYIRNQASQTACPADTFLQAGEFPRLKQVELHNCIVPWHAACLRNLTSLTLTLSAADTVYFLNVLRLLPNNPALTHLSLRNALPGRFNLSDDIPTRVSCPALTHLDLANDICSFHYILDALHTPHLSHLELDAWDDRYQDLRRQIPDTEFETFSRHLGMSLWGMGVSLLTVDASCRHVHRRGDLALEVLKMEVACVCERTFVQDTDNTFKLNLRFHKLRMSHDRHAQDLFSTFLQELPHQQLQTLTLDTSCRVEHPVYAGQDRVANLVPTLPSLKSATFKDSKSSDTLAGMLGHLESPARNSATEAIYFPALDVLTFEAPHSGPSAALATSIIVRIVSALRTRSQAGIEPVPVIRLHMVRGEHTVLEVEVQSSGVMVYEVLPAGRHLRLERPTMAQIAGVLTEFART